MSSKTSSIQILPPLVAERIAAGEVIERPASVVKELVENSLDAGADQIAVILENGGRNLIEVLDNGEGISKKDLPLCLLRHATSKLSRLEDLETLQTLGFRGEALASIQAVAQVRVLSRNQGSEQAYEIEGGITRKQTSEVKPITFGHFLGSPHGTQIRVANLFSEIPARLKFLKSSRSELAAIKDLLEKFALTHPRVQFRLVHDDQTLFQMKAQKPQERIQTLLGAQTKTDLLSESFKEDSLEIDFYWVRGLSLPHARKIYQSVNGRIVRDRLLQQALLQPFRQRLLPGQFPALACFVKIAPDQIDVNVHPSKTEIRFLNSQAIFQKLQRTVESLLQKQLRSSPSHPVSFHSPAPSAAPSFSLESAHAFRESFSGTSSAFPSLPYPPAFEETKLELETASPLGQFRGILFNTYLVFEMEDHIKLYDQHAAHERIRYEALQKRHLENETPARQQLLMPQTLGFDPDQKHDILKSLPLLEKLGFDAELFGEKALVFRSVPEGWGTDDLRTRLQNLLERALSLGENSSSLKMDEAVFEQLASEACHSSVRSGDRLTEFEALQLCRDLLNCKHPWNCPHGRPTVIELSHDQIDQWFQRKTKLWKNPSLES